MSSLGSTGQIYFLLFMKRMVPRICCVCYGNHKVRWFMFHMTQLINRSNTQSHRKKGNWLSVNI